MLFKLSKFNLTVTVVFIQNVFIVVCGQFQDDVLTRNTYTKQLIKQLGNGTTITVKDLEDFYFTRQIVWNRNQQLDDTLNNCFAAGSTRNLQAQESCLLKTCLSPTDVIKLSGLSKGNNGEAVCTMSMILLHLLESKTCIQNPQFHKESTAQHDASPSQAETWGYGLLCTSIIVLAALIGFLTLPFVRGINYQRALIYMVGLAVGSLAGSSLLFLLPEALELTGQEMNENNYVWKCLVMVIAIYSFFIIERVLKLVTSWREKRKKASSTHQTTHDICFISLPLEKSKVPNYTDLDIPVQLSTCTENASRDSGIDDLDKTTANDNENNVKARNGDNNLPEVQIENEDIQPQEKKEIAPVAWMIIFGDALHNLIDGVSIGAAFTENVLAGVSVSVAVFCEELPHELGDFAVLLSAGMKKKKAVLFNFLSACTIYVGMIVGIFLGENASAHTWVFAFAGGMFLYIALVDMMPAMCLAGELEENKKQIGTVNIFILQNVGMLTGFGIMLVLAIYGGNIEEAITETT